MSSSSGDAGARRRLAAVPRLCVAFAAALAVSCAQAQEALRPEVGKPLLAAQHLIKEQRFKEALAKVRDADAVGGKTANESAMVERMRIAAASGAGDTETVARSFEALSAAGGLATADKLPMIESIAGGYYRMRDYTKALQWAQRYFGEGGTNPAMRGLLIQSQYLRGDYAGAIKELGSDVQSAERGGAAPGEDRLKLLLSAALKQRDNNAYRYALEKLVSYYPKKEYWAELLASVQHNAGFASRLELDAYRLALATGAMTSASDFMEMAQLALQADLPAEGKQVVDQGFAAGVLGTGPDAPRQKRLRALADKSVAESRGSQAEAERQALAARSGSALLDVGMNHVYGGQRAKGLQLMQQGVAKGGLKRPEDAKLHLAIAYLANGENAKAQALLKTVAGSDGTADLARLWALYARRKG